MGRTTYYPGTPGGIVDPSSISQNSGRQISWADVPDTFKGPDGNKHIPALTAMAEKANGQIYPRPAVEADPGNRVATEKAKMLLLTNAVENQPQFGKNGFGCLVGGVLYENLLPDATGNPKLLPAAIKTELASFGCNFVFEQYADTRA